MNHTTEIISRREFESLKNDNNKRKVAQVETPQFIYQSDKKFRVLLVRIDDENQPSSASSESTTSDRSSYLDDSEETLSHETMLQLGIKNCPSCNVLTQKEGSCNDMVIFKSFL
jgi:hypothetical protein